MAPAITTAKEPREPTRASSRLQGLPSDKSQIPLGPSVPKKRKKAEDTHPPNDDEVASPLVPLPPKPKGRPKQIPTQTNQEPQNPLPDAQPANKKRKSSKPTGKSKSKSKGSEQEPTVEAAPNFSAEAPVQDLSENGAENKRKKSTRKKKVSELAGKVAAQEKTADEKKALKEKRKKDRADAVPINESPNETEAFLASVRGFSQSAGAVPQSASAPSTQAAPVRPIRSEQREEALQFLKSNLVASLSDTSSVIARSISASPQSNPLSTPFLSSAAPSALPSRAHTPTLSIHSTRDDSPGPFQDQDDEMPFDEGGVEQEELLAALKGLPKYLAPVVELSEPLKGPGHLPQRSTPLADIDMAGLSARQRKSLKASRKLKVHSLVESDRLVVSAALDRAKAIFITHNPYPARPVASMIAAQANAWACRKFRTNMIMEVDGEYEDLVLQRFGTLRNAMHAHALKEVPIRFLLKSTAGDNQEAMAKNMETVEMWLLGLNFTCPDAEHLTDFYENPLFYDLIKVTYFANAKGSGPSHPDLWSSAITVPCLAHAATVVEKVLTDYSISGTHKKSDFEAETYGPKWMSHVITLKEMYCAHPERLEKHCRTLAFKLMSPFGVQKAVNKAVGPRISVSRIGALYGKGTVPPTGELSPGAATQATVTPRHKRKASGPSMLRQATPSALGSPNDFSTSSPLSAVLGTTTSSTSTSALQSPIMLSEPDSATHRHTTHRANTLVGEQGDNEWHNNFNGESIANGERGSGNQGGIDSSSESSSGSEESGSSKSKSKGKGSSKSESKGKGKSESESESGSESESESESGSESESESESDGDGARGAGPASLARKQAASEASGYEVDNTNDVDDEEGEGAGEES